MTMLRSLMAKSPLLVSLVALLDKSHMSAHCYSDQGKLAFNVFTCGVDPECAREVARDVRAFLQEHLGDNAICRIHRMHRFPLKQTMAHMWLPNCSESNLAGFCLVVLLLFVDCFLRSKNSDGRHCMNCFTPMQQFPDCKLKAWKKFSLSWMSSARNHKKMLLACASV